MAQRDVLAGAGGVLLGAARTDHAGRRAVLVVRGEEDTTEFTDLAKTMGIDVVDEVRGHHHRPLDPGGRVAALRRLGSP